MGRNKMKKLLAIIGALAFLIPSISLAVDYGSNFLTGGTATVNFGANPGNAVDGNIATGWDAYNNPLPSWWKYDLGASITKTAAKIKIAPYGDANGRQIKQFYISGSNDDSAWTDVATTTLTNILSTTSTDFEFSNASAYRYYRITITNPTWYTPAPTVGGSIHEVEMYEVATPTPITQIFNQVILWLGIE
jgi:hypothetical protein